MGVGTTTIYQLLNDGKLRSTKIGRRRLILVSSILALMGEERAA
jgi:excisionase family DNA binding protein